MEGKALKGCPIGTQTFEKLREGDMLYIDKTEYIHRMVHSTNTYFFLSRPRRFGKSLLTSTLKSYFEGRQDLFEGLAIKQYEKEWTKHPGLHFAMKYHEAFRRGKSEDGTQREVDRLRSHLW